MWGGNDLTAGVQGKLCEQGYTLQVFISSRGECWNTCVVPHAVWLWAELITADVRLLRGALNSVIVLVEVLWNVLIVRPLVVE